MRDEAGGMPVVERKRPVMEAVFAAKVDELVDVCGIADRNRLIVEVGRHYGLTIATCVPADPQSKGGSEATVRVARADLVPTDHNLRGEYEDFAALERACEEFMADVNSAASHDDAAADLPAGGEA
jgi:dihydropteroate synthase